MDTNYLDKPLKTIKYLNRKPKQKTGNCIKLTARRFPYKLLSSGHLSGFNREDEEPSRSRRCDRGRNLHEATFPLEWKGKAQGVGRSGSQKTCLEVWSHCAGQKARTPETPRTSASYFLRIKKLGASLSPSGLKDFFLQDHLRKALMLSRNQKIRGCRGASPGAPALGRTHGSAPTRKWSFVGHLG
jgi:hypothetical protein